MAGVKITLDLELPYHCACLNTSVPTSRASDACTLKAGKNCANPCSYARAWYCKERGERSVALSIWSFVGF